MKSLILTLLVASVSWGQISVVVPAQQVQQVSYEQNEKITISTLGPFPTDGSNKVVSITFAKPVQPNTVITAFIKGLYVTPFDSFKAGDTPPTTLTVTIGPETYNSPGTVLSLIYWSLTK